MAIVCLPQSLIQFAGGKEKLEIKGGSVLEVLKNLESLHPGVTEKIMDSQFRLRNFVGIFVGAEYIRTQSGLETKVQDDSSITILTALAGG